MADVGPSAQSVGREFVRQYYTMLNERPDCLHRSVSVTPARFVIFRSDANLFFTLWIEQLHITLASCMLTINDIDICILAHRNM